jgi:hypothetical protein
MDVFQLFDTSDYTFLQLESKTGGNTIVEEWEANGIVKLRDGMLQVDNVESYDSSATAHVRPTEPFVALLEGNLVGHGLRVTKGSSTAEYRITGQVEGYDFDSGTLEFLKVTLKKEKIWDESGLPLD